MKNSDWVTAVLSLLSVIISIIAIVLTSKQAQISRTLEERLDNRDRAIENRRFVTTELWDRMTQLNHVDPASIVPEDVRRAVNTLQMIAMCWNAQLVDREMVVIAFGTFFDELCAEITAINSPIAGLRRTGYELISQTPAISTVRDEIRTQLQKSGTMAPI